MTVEDHEVEQDHHLRALRVKQAQEEARQAALNLMECEARSRALIEAITIAMLAVVMLATTILFLLRDGH